MFSNSNSIRGHCIMCSAEDQEFRGPDGTCHKTVPKFDFGAFRSPEMPSRW